MRRYERKSTEVGVFRRGLVTLSADFRGKGASPTNHCWCQKTRVIAVSCGIKISAVHHLVLSQYTRLTCRRTELRQQYRALHYICSRTVKTEDRMLSNKHSVSNANAIKKLYSVSKRLKSADALLKVDFSHFSRVATFACRQQRPSSRALNHCVH